MKFLKSWHSKIWELLNNLLTLDLPVNKISQSLALGVFIGLTVPFGLQTLSVLPIVLLFRCNFPITWSGTLISNPFTVLPIYIAAVFVGERVTGIKVSFEEINNMINNPLLNSLGNFGFDTIMVLVSGTMVMGVVLSVTVYYLSFFLITWHRERIKQHSDIYP